jgi:protein ImuB
MSKRAKRAADLAAETSDIFAVLHKWGIHTVGQLTALDKQELGARLGPVAIQLWERANGKTTRLLKRIAPIEVFEEQFEFENEIETAEPLLFMLRRFLQQFSLRLGALYLVAKELTLRITFADPPQDGSAAADKKFYEHTFKIPEPTNDTDLLFRMLQTHLEDFRSDAPITSVSLRAQPATAGQQQFGLFETALRDPAQLAETLARLTALLGSDRVGTPVLADTHEPDQFEIEPFVWELPSAEPEVGMALRAVRGRVGDASLPCVLRRFRSASSAVVLLDERKPAHLRSAEMSGRVAEQSGPFVSSGNWWNENAWRRAEWDLELDHGAVCRCHCDGQQWRIDGVYD